jgi:hypothetical protein
MNVELGFSGSDKLRSASFRPAYVPHDAPPWAETRIITIERSVSTGQLQSSHETKKMAHHRIFTTKFSKVYPLYVQKAERKNRTKEEVDRVICWLTGYSQTELQQQIEQESDFETFFARAPSMHPQSGHIKGVVCGVRVEEIEDPLMRKIRCLDKLIDELAKGKSLEKVLRQSSAT